MKKGLKKKFNGLVVSALTLGLLASPTGGITASAAGSLPTNVLSNEAFVNLKIMGTTDVHGSIMNHDYYSDTANTATGLVRVATAINEERAENPNNLLFDNGDMLQGNPFADYFATVNRPTSVKRLAGGDRYGTAVQVSQKGWESAETVIIVRGDDFADALTAGPLAYKLNAPILLTRTNGLDDQTKNEIKRLGAKQAIIIGGNLAVSSNVSSTLSSKLGLTVKRIQGGTRFETAASVAKELGNTDKAVLVNGRDFPDAISVSAYAAKNELPILLTEVNGIPQATVEALKNVTETVLVGGNLAISEKVEKSVNGAKRVAGQTRFDTSVKVATELDKVGDKVFVANGRGFADALTGSVLAAKEGATIVLTEQGYLPSGVAGVVDSKYVTVLGGEIAVAKDLIKDEKHPIYETMNAMKYDAATLGNHEFNYGMDFLMNSIDDAEFPFVNANVYWDDHDNDPTNDKNIVKPYKIINKEVVDNDGNKQIVKVGVIGFVPDKIMQWDKANLEGKVVAEDIIKSAKKWVPEIEKEGVDIIVALAHTGNSGDETDTENAVFGLSKIPGIEAIIYGHSHQLFKGDVNGIPAVQAGFDASNLGVIDLDLKKVDGKWAVNSFTTELVKVDAKTPDAKLVESLKTAHDDSVAYINNPVGELTAPINSYFARVQDDPSVQLVNNAQKDYIEKVLKGTAYENLPVLSAAAPFKSGGRGGSASDLNDYTNIPAGTIAIKNVADLYKYPNTVQAVKLTGAELKHYLEWTATGFNRIDPSLTTEQELVNTEFRGYNFDVVDGLTYEIDVTQPARFNIDGSKVVNADATRIKNLQYNGQPVTDEMEFVIATNNYRASNPIFGSGKNVIYASADESRQVIINYIKDNKVINPSADKNWKISPIDGDVNVTFKSNPAAKSFAEGTDNITFVEDLESGFAKFNINLGKVDEKYTLNIMHTNDTHANLDNIAKKMTAIKTVRAEKPDALLLDAGDVLTGTLYFNEYQGLADLEFMKLAGYDAMTFGNHEFDSGTGVLANFVKGANFPFVSSNVNFTNDANLQSRFHNDTVTANAVDGDIFDGIIKEVNGEKVGIFGLTTAETPTISSPGKDVVFEDYLDEARESVAALKAQGVNKIVALTHIGYDDSLAWDNDLELAKQVEGIDVIVGGHTHSKLDAPVFDRTGEEPTVIVQANEYNKFLGTLDVTFDKDGKVIIDETTGKLMDVTQYAEDAETKQILDTKYKPAVDEKKATVVGEAAVELIGGNPPARTGETNLGNFIADGMLAKAQSINKDTLIAVQNGGGIRTTLKTGNITLANVLTVLPFGNTLAIMDLKGSEIKAALEHGVSAAPSASGGFLQVAGLKFTFDSTKPAGQRVQTVEVKGKDGNYTALDLNQNYYVATNVFTAKGGDGFTMFGAAYAEGRVSEPGFVDWEIFNDYILAQPDKIVNPAMEGRITQVMSAANFKNGTADKAAVYYGNYVVDVTGVSKLEYITVKGNLTLKGNANVELSNVNVDGELILED